MKTKTAQSASYRVPTGAEIKAFIECLNLAVKVGHRLTFASGGTVWDVARVEVVDLDRLVVVTVCGLPFGFNLVGILPDTFGFTMPGNRQLFLCSPCWLGGDK